MDHGHLEQGCDLLGTSKKGKDASKKMQAHKGQCLVEHVLALCMMYVCIYIYIPACVWVIVHFV